MAVVYDIEHTTSYKYKNPVTLAEHRALFLPRVGHGGRVLSYSIATNVPSKTRWIMDALSNSVALIEFTEPTTELVVTFKFSGEHYGAADIEEFPVDPRGQEFPVQHTPDEWTDLASFMIRRGTAYGPELPEGALEDDGVDRGLMFAFVGAHLGRQFEFVQSEWMNGGDFLGLGDVKDPIAGVQDTAGAYSFPRKPIPRMLRGLPQFVLTRGGEYCFMPSLRALRWLAKLET